MEEGTVGARHKIVFAALDKALVHGAALGESGGRGDRTTSKKGTCQMPARINE